MKHPVEFAVAMAILGTSFAASAKTLYQDLHDFAGGPADGDMSYSDLVADGQGRLYGTTYFGGAFGDGTLYRVTLPTGKMGPATIEILHSFQPSDGTTPVGGVLIGADGGLYGTTNAGGAHNGGTVYRIDPASFALTVLHDFDPGGTPEDGSASQAGMVAGPNGLLYGTTTSNGPLGGGTVFAISPKGDGVAYAVIYAFGASGDANHPLGRLVATGKNLFGTTFFGGQFGLGTVFELSQAGAKGGTWSESGLYAFGTNPSDALFPPNGLVLAKSGLLYGCAGGGSFASGAIYSITPAKGGAPLQESVIFNFGANPGDPFPNGACGLTIDNTGRLVGTSNLGGTNRSGTLFTLTPGGGTWTLAVPYSFGIQANGDAVQPAAAVLGVANGYYAGTTPIGGASGKGAVYRVKP